MADIGGGGLMDIGCYSISLSRFIFEDDPKNICGLIEYDPQLNIDRIASGILEFDNIETKNRAVTKRRKNFRRCFLLLKICIVIAKILFKDS